MRRKKNAESSRKPASSPRRRGGRPPSALQKSLGWYAGQDLDLPIWWQSDEELFQKMETDLELRLTGKGEDHLATTDLHAAFFWEALRRHPDSRALKQLHEELWTDRLKGRLSSRTDKVPLLPVYEVLVAEYGHGLLDALETHSSFAKLAYPALVANDPRAWLGGYRALWRLIGKKEGLPAVLPPGFAGATKLNPHGAACIDLIRSREPGDAPTFQELLQPASWNYQGASARGIPIGSFAEAEDETSTVVPVPAVEDLKLVGRAAAGDETHEFYDFQDVAFADRRRQVDLRVHLGRLKKQLEELEMKPLVLGVNLDAPTPLLVKEFRAIVTALKARRPQPRKVRKESFRALESLDQEVGFLSGDGVVSAATAKAYESATQIDAAVLLSRCSDLLEQRALAAAGDP